jgi:RNA polymerase sigma-70 factor (ECF subfamily)
MPAAPDWDADRGYLLVLARLRLPAWLRAKVEASDVVQQTLLRAHAHANQLRADSADGRRAWLRQILANVIHDAARRFTADARDASREQVIRRGLDESSARLDALIAADQSSPSRRVNRVDELVRLTTAIERLPPDQRTAVELKHLEGWSVNRIAAEMGKSAEAVGGLLRRGMAALRAALAEGNTDG